MPLRLSRLGARSRTSPIRSMTAECQDRGGISNLAQGVCDTPPPPIVVEAAARAMREGQNIYTRREGTLALRRAIAGKLARDNGIVVDPETELVVSVGSTGAFLSAARALLDPGDEVVLFEPFYGYHYNTILSLEMVPRLVETQPPDWSFRPEDLEAALSERTRAIVVCSPANPSGKVFEESELELISRLARERDLFVFTDEIYEYFLYDDRCHRSPGARPEIADRVITLNGYSKTFSVTGWRIGYAAADARWSTAIGHLNDLSYVCAPSPLQAGVAAGIEALGRDYYDGLAATYARKRDRICEALRQGGLEPYVPQGAYYVLADARAISGTTSDERALGLLDATGVASVPGRAFFREGRGEELLRFCFAKTDAELDEACERLAAR